MKYGAVALVSLLCLAGIAAAMAATSSPSRVTEKRVPRTSTPTGPASTRSTPPPRSSARTSTRPSARMTAVSQGPWASSWASPSTSILPRAPRSKTSVRAALATGAQDSQVSVGIPATESSEAPKGSLRTSASAAAAASASAPPVMYARRREIPLCTAWGPSRRTVSRTRRRAASDSSGLASSASVPSRSRSSSLIAPPRAREGWDRAERRRAAPGARGRSSTGRCAPWRR